MIRRGHWHIHVHIFGFRRSQVAIIPYIRYVDALFRIGQSHQCLLYRLLRSIIFRCHILTQVEIHGLLYRFFNLHDHFSLLGGLAKVLVNLLFLLNLLLDGLLLELNGFLFSLGKRMKVYWRWDTRRIHVLFIVDARLSA